MVIVGVVKCSCETIFKQKNETEEVKCKWEKVNGHHAKDPNKFSWVSYEKSGSGIQARCG